jgi:hypothetical protein
MRIRFPQPGANPAREGMVAAGKVMTVSRIRMNEIQLSKHHKDCIDSFRRMGKIAGSTL